MAAFGLGGCVVEQNPPASTNAGSSTTPPAVGVPPDQAALPAPEALAGVLSTLADTSVPAEQKVAAVQYATADDEASLTKFGEALRDSGYVPVTVVATDVKWSTTPGNVTATITISSPNQAANPFAYPMEFSPEHDTWQLTKKSADQLLPLGGA